MSQVLQVQCPGCGQLARVNAALQGHRWTCQRCGRAFEVPAAPPPPDPEFVALKCQCGKTFRVHSKYAGKRAQCPSCGAKLVIPAAEPAPLASPAQVQPVAPATPAQPEHEIETAADAGSSRLLLVTGVVAAILTVIGVTAFLTMKEPPKPKTYPVPRSPVAQPSVVMQPATAPAVARAPEPSRMVPRTALPAMSRPAAETEARMTPAIGATQMPPTAENNPSAPAVQVRTITTEERMLGGHKAPITDLTFSTDGKYMATSASRPDACVILWDASTGREIRRFADPGTRVVNALALSADNRLLLSTDGPKSRVWDVETGRQLQLLSAHTSDVLAVAFTHRAPATPGGPQLAVTGGWDKTIRLWDAAQGKELRNFDGHTAIVTALAWAPDDLTFASAAQDGTVRWWDVSSGRQLRQWSTGCPAISAMAISPDGSSVAVGGRPYVRSKQTVAAENPLCLWSMDGQEIRRFPVTADGVSDVAFSRDGRYLLSSDSNRAGAGRHSSDELRVRMWNVADATEVLRLRGSPFAIGHTCLAPDGRHIVTAVADGAIRFWLLPEEITIEPAPAPLLAATAEVKSLPAIAKTVSAEVQSLITAGQLEQAHQLIEEAQSDLRHFAAATQIPLWDNSISPLLRMADAKRQLLAQKGFVDPQTGTTQPAGASGKLTPEQTHELVGIRGTLSKASTQVRENKLTAAQATIFEAQEKLNAFAASSGVPEWTLAVASVYQLAAARQTELETRRNAEETRATVLAEQVRKKAADATAKSEAEKPQTQDGLPVGQLAPVFTAATLDGRQFNLAQFRGKWVLIDFWATWCGPCVAEMPNLKDLYATYGKEKKFVMISLTIDTEVEKPVKFASENQLGWIMGFLGQGWNAPVLKAFNVHGIPAMFLIAPDGRISAKSLRGERIKATVGEALASKTPTAGTPAARR